MHLHRLPMLDRIRSSVHPMTKPPSRAMHPVGAAIGTWQLVQGTGVIADPSSPTTLVTDLEVGENIFTWTLQGGICVTTVDSVSLLVFDPENPDAYAGLDQELCMPEDSVLMAGTNLIFQRTAHGPRWSVVVHRSHPVTQAP